MKTYRILAYILFSFALLSCSSLDTKDLITEFKSYQNTIISRVYRTTVNYVIPEVFEYMSEDDYVFKMIRKLEETKDYKLSLGSYSSISVSDIEEIEGVQYAIIKFMQERIQDNKKNDELDENMLNSRREVEKEAYGMALGKDNVEYDSANDRLIFKIENRVIAKYDDNSKNWKFINLADAGMYVMNELFPEELLEKVPEDANYKRLKENKN